MFRGFGGFGSCQSVRSCQKLTHDTGSLTGGWFQRFVRLSEQSLKKHPILSAKNLDKYKNVSYKLGI